VQEMIALAKARPGQILFSSGGRGTNSHLATELFASMAQIRLVHVPYKGSTPGVIDLMAGHVSLMTNSVSTLLAHVRSGKLRALGVASEKRNAFLPDIPTMSEVLPGFVSETWIGVVAPPKTPPEIANKISAAIAEVLKLPDVAKGITDLSADPVGSTPAEMAVFMKQESERWGSVIRSAGAKAD